MPTAHPCSHFGRRLWVARKALHLHEPNHEGNGRSIHNSFLFVYIFPIFSFSNVVSFSLFFIFLFPLFVFFSHFCTLLVFIFHKSLPFFILEGQTQTCFLFGWRGEVGVPFFPFLPQTSNNCGVWEEGSCSLKSRTCLRVGRRSLPPLLTPLTKQCWRQRGGAGCPSWVVLPSPPSIKSMQMQTRWGHFFLKRSGRAKLCSWNLGHKIAPFPTPSIA